MEDLKKIPHQAAIRSLLYAAEATRPYTGYLVNLLCQFFQKPNKTHETTAKCIMCYLRGTTETTLTYFRYHDDEIVSYYDTNYGGDTADQRSTTG